MLRHTTMLCVVVLFSHSALVSATDSDNADYLANYVINWEKTKSGFSGCESGIVNKEHFMLGECPTSNTINLYYVTGALLHYTAASLLPKKYSDRLKRADLVFNVSYTKYSSQFGISFYY